MTLLSRIRRILISSMALSSSLALLPPVAAQDELPAAAEIEIDFAKHIQPILEETCHRCHGERRQRSEFRIDSREAALKGGEIGVAIVVGKSAESPLVRYIAGLEEDLEMPPSGDPLTDEQIGLIRAWIDQGLKWSEAKPEVEEVAQPRLEKATYPGAADRVTGLALKHGTGILASAGGQSLPFRPGTVTFIDLASGKEIGKLPEQASLVWSVAFSPDGKKVATGSYDKLAKIFDAESGEQIVELKGHDNWVTAVAFSPDGKVVATGSEDATIRLWDATSGEELAKLEGHGATVRSLAFTPDGSRLVSGSQDTTARVWDVASRKEVAKLEGHEDGIFDLALSPDGKTLATASADRSVRLWNLADAKELKKIDAHTNWVISAAFSPDGKYLATGGYDNLVKIWDATSGAEVKALPGHESAVWDVLFLPDGKLVASGSQDGTVKVWEVGERKLMRF